MTGEQLYKLYSEKSLEIENCDTDAWEELNEVQQQVWNAMAAHLMEG